MILKLNSLLTILLLEENFLKGWKIQSFILLYAFDISLNNIHSKSFGYCKT